MLHLRFVSCPSELIKHCEMTFVQTAQDDNIVITYCRSKIIFISAAIKIASIVSISISFSYLEEIALYYVFNMMAIFVFVFACFHYIHVGYIMALICHHCKIKLRKNMENVS